MNDKDIRDLPWFTGQQWRKFDWRQPAHAIMGDAYKSARVGTEAEAEVYVKHVVICTGVADDPEGVPVADLSALFALSLHGGRERTPRADADLGEYICKLHNDDLARRQKAPDE